MGAWIEIVNPSSASPEAPVAPLVGAWIEIQRAFAYLSTARVAPLVGAWIEICKILMVYNSQSRRSPCGSVD